MARGGAYGAFSRNSTLYSIVGALVLFLLCQFLMMSRDCAMMSDRKMTLEAEVASQQRKLEEVQHTIWIKERDMHRANRALKELENRLRAAKKDLNRGGRAPTILIVTPSRQLPTQIADLTRLSYTLMHVPNVHWIVVEDAAEKSSSVAGILQRSGLRSTHLSALTPPEFKMNDSNPNWLKPRGVAQRNAALTWMRTNLAGGAHGVVYFADDDNTYDVRLFEEMRPTKKVSVWPVGIVGGLLVERPKVDPSSGQVTGWLVGWKPERPFPIDMAGFAVSLRLLLNKPEVVFSYEVQRGYQESHFLSQLVTVDELEPKANGCTKVYVWHTKTERANLKREKQLKATAQLPSDYGIEL